MTRDARWFAAEEVADPAQRRGVVTHNGGGGVFLVGSRFEVDGCHAEILLRSLTPIVHIAARSDQAALRWSSERKMEELREDWPGASLVAQHLTQRSWCKRCACTFRSSLEGGSDGSPPLSDPQVGETPINYLTCWRMMLAADRLANTRDPVAEVATSLGCETETAFSTAFSRVTGCSPRRYARATASRAGLGHDAALATDRRFVPRPVLGRSEDVATRRPWGDCGQAAAD